MEDPESPISFNKLSHLRLFKEEACQSYLIPGRAAGGGYVVRDML